jgi:hypothetical protein
MEVEEEIHLRVLMLSIYVQNHGSARIYMSFNDDDVHREIMRCLCHNCLDDVGCAEMWLAGGGGASCAAQQGFS